MILVRFLDLKFLHNRAAIMIGTSNPPHQGPTSKRYSCVFLDETAHRDDAVVISVPLELPAAAVSPGPADGAPATAMAKSPAARSEPMMALALIQRSNSHQSCGDHFSTMSRFSKTPSVRRDAP